MESLANNVSLMLAGLLLVAVLVGFLLGRATKRGAPAPIRAADHGIAKVEADRDAAVRARADAERALERARGDIARLQAELSALKTAAPPPVSAPVTDAPLTSLKGLGPKLAATLADQGITTLQQLAALSNSAAAELDSNLGPFTGRLTRDRLVEQAKLLTEGRTAEYTAIFGPLP
ncbi:helix-hairpin-helix domain-containing protein [Sandaracinobacteroides saxicola]|uniref:Uncharacterized protein n=1 Tax=Sandaracinobacteroides saxicola TaxID=2759707 RepID=A0A7G5ILJ3_9SPHN|nr:helix-hairpin-helix domain-containing protein [Sandaracinobacteroides saxicola]QMW24235.1 hypothetical protein H3309_07220 [Sandaracinobacteroides saxicola]